MADNPIKDLYKISIKPVWKVTVPSEISPDDYNESKGPDGTFTVYGVESGGLDINHNWEKLNSVEQYGQGWLKKPDDNTFTIAVKERGSAFENMRRISAAGLTFDVLADATTDDLKDVSDSDRIHEWLEGLDKFTGCIVLRESQTINYGEMPIREYECGFLRHIIKSPSEGDFSAQTGGIVEGDGNFTDAEDIVLSFPEEESE